VSTDGTQGGPGGADAGPGQPSGEAGAGGSGEPTEEQLRAAYEEELSRITATDVIAQASVSLLNIGARRLAPPGDAPSDARDLEQVRDAIDAVRALLEILERRVPQELGPLRDALSRLQMSYAREIAPGAPAAADPRAEAPAGRAHPRGRRQASSRRRASDRPAPGRRSPAAGSGCPGADAHSGARALCRRAPVRPAR
jgi:hypothetical protein